MALTQQQIENGKRFERRQKQLEELRKRQAQEAAAKSPEKSSDESTATTPKAVAPRKSTPQGTTPEEIALGQRDEKGNYQETENTAEKQERDSGPVTKIAEGLNYLVGGADSGGGAIADASNALIGGLNALTRDTILSGVDDFWLGSEEAQKAKLEKAEKDAERDSSGEMGGAEKALYRTSNTLEGVGAGIEGGIALPATILARLTNQATPWADPPEVLKQSPMGQLVFEITQILVPTLLTGSVASAYGAPAVGTTIVGASVESGIETASQDSFEDLIAGRSLAGKFGELADALGMDGAGLTKDLIEGKTFESQAFTAVIGFFQNLGINFVPGKVLEKIGSSSGKKLVANPLEEKVAKVLKQDPDTTVKQLNDRFEPNYTPDAEPSDAVDINSTVLTVKPSSPENPWISEPGMIAEILRKKGIAEDGFDDAQRNFFTNWEAITTKKSYQASIQIATNTLKKLKDFPSDLKTVTERGLLNFQLIKQSLDLDDFDNAARIFREGSTAPINNSTNAADIPDEIFLREFAMTDRDGFVAAGLIGEELGMRLKKAATQANNLEGIGVDFTNAVENLLELQDKAALFMTPLRRGKRVWAVTGTAQQQRQLLKLGDADITDALRKIDPASADAPSNIIERIKGVDGFEKNTVRELYDQYKAGDVVSGQTLKAYINTVAYSDPRTVLTTVVDLTKTLTDNVKRGNNDAVQALMYAGRLSRLGTQTAANLNTVLLTVGDPIGNMLSGVKSGFRNNDWSESAYGWGTFVGGLEGAQDGLNAFIRSVRTNEQFVKQGGQRFDTDVQNLKMKQEILEEAYTGAKKRLNDFKASEAEKFSLWLSYKLQTMGNNPAVGYGARLLMAADEGMTVIRGAQIARGRAFQEAIQTGTFSNKKELQRLIKVNNDKIFLEGKRTGKIVDGEVLQSARKLTFTSQINELGSDLEIKGFGAVGNLVDNAFQGLEDAAKSSGYWNLVSPFTRVSYESLEAVARYDPIGFTRRLHPRYKAILAGEYGETARLQLKSNIAQGQLFTIGTIGLAYFGGMTGENSGNMPKRSFIIPAPGTEKGYIALSYARLEPYATIFATTTDFVQGLRDEVISQGQYSQFIQNMGVSIGMSLIDKSFMDGMHKMVDLLDVNRLATGNIAPGLAGFSANFAPRIFDMISDFASPFKSVAGNDENGLVDYLEALRKSSLGGVGLPPDYDIFTGKKIPKGATLGDSDNYWAAVGGTIISELGWTGNAVNAAVKDEVRNKLDEIGIKPKTAVYFRSVNGVSLNSQETSDLKRGMHEYGKLSERLKNFFRSDDFTEYYKAMHDRRRYQVQSLGNTMSGAARIPYELIKGRINEIYSQAKLESAKAVLYSNPDFREKKARIEMNSLRNF